MPHALMRMDSGLVSILFVCLVAWGPSVASAEGEMSAECMAFRANIGGIMRAGCEPTLAQMSKLMDSTSSTILVSSRTNGQPPVLLQDSEDLRSRARVTAPGSRTARRVASRR